MPTKIAPKKIGENAPHFTLLNQQNQPISLEQFIGHKVLIYFYPKAMTPGCTMQACGLRDSKAELEKQNVIVLGISPDSPEKLAKFEAKQALNFTLLSDPDHQVAQSFGVWGEKKFMGRTFDGIHRISFLIDEEGKIEQVFTGFKTSEHHQIVLDFLYR